MSTDRELREEEIRMDKVFQYIRNLDKMLWHGGFTLDDINEEIELINHNLNEIQKLLAKKAKTANIKAG